MFVQAINAAGFTNVCAVCAPGEADDWLHALCSKRTIDVVVSEDSDFIARGCPLLINFSVRTGRGQLYDRDAINKAAYFTNLSPYQRKVVTALSGTDYLDVFGCGPARALEYVKSAAETIGAGPSSNSPVLVSQVLQVSLDRVRILSARRYTRWQSWQN